MAAAVPPADPLAPFRNALARTGVNEPTSQVFIQYTDDEVDNLVKYIMKNFAPGDPDVFIPFNSIRRIEGLRFWATWHRRWRHPLDPDAFNNGALE